MIRIIKKKIIMTEELHSKITWACSFNNTEPKIMEGNLRIVEHTNLAYVEPHKVIIKNNLYLFFNNINYFYVVDLTRKIPISKLNTYIATNWLQKFIYDFSFCILTLYK